MSTKCTIDANVVKPNKIGNKVTVQDTEYINETRMTQERNGMEKEKGKREGNQLKRHVIFRWKTKRPPPRCENDRIIF